MTERTCSNLHTKWEVHQWCHISTISRCGIWEGVGKDTVTSVSAGIKKEGNYVPGPPTVLFPRLYTAHWSRTSRPSMAVMFWVMDLRLNLGLELVSAIVGLDGGVVSPNPLGRMAAAEAENWKWLGSINSPAWGSCSTRRAEGIPSRQNRIRPER